MAVPSRRVPPLDSWILEYLAAEWPGFGDLRSAASAPGQRDRLRNAVSILVNDVRVAMAGAFLTVTRRPSPGAAGPLSAADTSRIDADAARARHLHNCARMLLSDGLRPLATAWHFSERQVDLVREQFARVVGPLAGVAEGAARPLSVPTSGPRPERRPFEHAVHLFLAAVGQGMAFEQALQVFGFLITDARFANEMYSDWGLSYTTASQLSSTLNRCDFTFSVDISDAYHLLLWAGCGGELRAVRRTVLSTRRNGAERLTWIDALVNGCTPSSCHGGCDKDMSGIMIDGHIFRFASCQFGQKTAGSPQGSIVRSVGRYFARLQSPVHVAAWVDDREGDRGQPAGLHCAIGRQIFCAAPIPSACGGVGG